MDGWIVVHFGMTWQLGNLTKDTKETVIWTCLMRVSNSTPFLATNPAVLSTMFFTSGGGWMIGISASATIFTPEMFQSVRRWVKTQHYCQRTGGNARKQLFFPEALQRLPNAERRAGRISGTERYNGRWEAESEIRGANSQRRRPLPAV